AYTRVIFAVSPLTPHGQKTTAPPSAVPQFVAFVQQLARTFPTVKDYVIGNEPNQPRFWVPQFSPADKPLAAAAYLRVLAQSYDALKAIDPTINVIGIGLSPRGNDRPHAPTNISRSPVRFIRDLGAAYRASHRTKPLMDELAFHPYPSNNLDSPTVGYVWPNAGVPNLARVKQAVWDAFHGTAQPTFAEARTKTFAKPLVFELDEVGWQVAIPPDLTTLYFGKESGTTIDEQTQAQYYANAISLMACDTSVRALNFFHLMDEPDLDRWQSGLERVDLTHRPSYDAVKTMIAGTGGKCQRTLVAWRHATAVVGARSLFAVVRTRPSSWKSWSFRAGGNEEASFRAGVFPATVTKRAIRRRLTTGRPAPSLASKGTIAAKIRVVSFPARRLKPGLYVFAIRMVATMNTQRTSLFVSRPFRVGPAGKPHKKRS
ncbi:MAG: hypothetical protein M3R39_02765, partial [Actinomycetota bacterium]|nr:hypothetical protein [Actinomycetota bacterium]